MYIITVNTNKLIIKIMKSNKIHYQILKYWRYIRHDEFIINFNFDCAIRTCLVLYTLLENILDITIL